MFFSAIYSLSEGQDGVLWWPHLRAAVKPLRPLKLNVAQCNLVTCEIEVNIIVFINFNIVSYFSEYLI